MKSGLLLLVLAASADGRPAPHPGFVDVASIPAEGSLKTMTLLDARAEAAFRAGHIPGARHADWLRYRDGLLRTGRLPTDLVELARALSTLGVRDEKPVVVCGAGPKGFGEEGRFAWMLAYLGHDNVKVLDGGCEAWRDAGRAWTREDESPAPAVGFTAQARPSLRAKLSDVEGRPSTTQLLDTRSYAEFHGATPYLEARGGRIPGALSFPFEQVFDDEGRVLAPDELRAALVRAGVDLERPVVAYCTGGVRSALVTFALRGVGVDARNYDGSFWEWAAEGRLPVETDSPQSSESR